jgi:hypothetical protein
VSLLPNDWQHTLSHRTRIGAGITFPKFFQKIRKEKTNLPIKQKGSQLKTGREKSVI